MLQPHYPSETIPMSNKYCKKKEIIRGWTIVVLYYAAKLQERGGPDGLYTISA